MARTSLKRIGIDARMYGLEHAGIGRYVMNLVDRSMSSNLPVEWVIFCHPSKLPHFQHRDNVQPIVSTVKHYSLSEQTTWLSQLNKAKLDLLHVPHFNIPVLYSKPFVVTIHDILWHHVRGGSMTTLSPLKYYLKYAAYRYVVSQAISRAQTIFVPSKYVKADLITTFPRIKQNNIRVTYEGISMTHIDMNSEIDQYQMSPYLLYVGSAYPHKNIPIIFHALRELHKLDIHIKLIVVGSRSIFLDVLKNQVAEMKLKGEVVFAGAQTDESVIKLMTHAACLVHPSKSEGFGLTGLEAMQVGCPVIAARAACLPEVYGDAAAFFHPDNPQELAHLIQNILSDDTFRKDLIARGHRQCQRYSWDQMVEETIGEYKKILY